MTGDKELIPIDASSRFVAAPASPVQIEIEIEIEIGIGIGIGIFVESLAD